MGGKCTILEIEAVQQWFATPPGQKYVSKALDKNFELLKDKINLLNEPDLKVDTCHLLNRILKIISDK